MTATEVAGTTRESGGRERARVVVLGGGDGGQLAAQSLARRTDATVTLRRVEGAPTITQIALVTVGRVPGIDDATLQQHAAAAKAGCPVSRALASVPTITLEASLAR